MEVRKNRLKIIVLISVIVIAILIAVSVAVNATGSGGIAKSVTFIENMDGAYVYFRAVDAAGNVGEWSEPQRIWIDNTAPTVTAKESSVTIKEGDVNVLEDYFTVVANGSNADVEVVCTIGGTVYTTTETLTVDGSPYTVVCTATKNGGNSASATIDIMVETAVPEAETLLVSTVCELITFTIPSGVNILKMECFVVPMTPEGSLEIKTGYERRNHCYA